LKVLTKALAIPLPSGLSTGVKLGVRFRAIAISTVFAAAWTDPLSAIHWTGSGAHRVEAALDALNHQIADHLAGYPRRCDDPADDFTIMAVQHESDANNLAVPADELQAVGTPAVSDRGVTTLPSCQPTPGVAGKQEVVFLHQLIDAFGIDWRAAAASPLALYERGDPTITVDWSGIDEATDCGRKLEVALASLRPALRTHAFGAVSDVRARDNECVSDGLHWEASFDAERDNEVFFCARAFKPCFQELDFQCLVPKLPF
jgi:hypothetical protein